MTVLPRRTLLAIATVLDVALHARPSAVSAKVLAARHDLPARHLEAILQALVRHGILKGTRGPRGGYELARDRRRVSLGDILRAVDTAGDETAEPGRLSDLLQDVVRPVIDETLARFLAALDAITVEDLCRRAGPRDAGGELHDIGL